MTVDAKRDDDAFVFGHGRVLRLHEDRQADRGDIPAGILRGIDLPRIGRDGRRALDLRPNGDQNLSQTRKIYLKRGVYPVHYELYFRYANTIPEIQVQEPGTSGTLELDHFSGSEAPSH